MYVDANPHVLACDNLKNGTVANIESEGLPLLVFLSFIILPCFLSNLFYGSIQIIPKEFCNMVMYYFNLITPFLE